jgi:hypothetical protein
MLVIAYSHETQFSINDETAHVIEADTPIEAIEKLLEEYDHPAGLYGAVVYDSPGHYNDPEGRTLPMLEWRP